MKTGKLGKLLALWLTFSLASVVWLLPTAQAEPYESSAYIGDLPDGRASAAYAAIGTDIYVIGGQRAGVMWDATALSSVMIYDVSTGETTYGTPMPTGVWGAASAMGSDGGIYVFGGYNQTASGSPLKITQIYYPATDTWESGADSPIGFHKASAVVAPDGRLYLFGSEFALNSTLIYDPELDSWSYGEDMITPAIGPSAVLLNDTTIAVIGGHALGGATATVRAYDIEADSWTYLASMDVAKNYAGAAMGRNGHVYSIGGTTGFTLDSSPQLYQIERYDIQEDEWEYAYVSLSTARSNFGTVVDEYGRIFVVGGYNQWSGVLSSIEMILNSEVEAVKRVVITSPADGSTVSGTIVIQASVKGIDPWGYYLTVDLLVDGELVESQGWGQSWTFIWDTTGLADGSSHTITVRAYDLDGRISEDTVTVTVSELSAEERLRQIEQAIADLQMNIDASIDALQTLIEELNSSLSADLASLSLQLSTLADDLSSLQSYLEGMNGSMAEEFAVLSSHLSSVTAQLAVLQASLNSMESSVSADLADLIEELESLNAALDDIGDTTEEAKETASSASMYAMLGMFVAIIVLIMVAVGIVLSRKK